MDSYATSATLGSDETLLVYGTTTVAVFNGEGHAELLNEELDARFVNWPP